MTEDEALRVLKLTHGFTRKVAVICSLIASPHADVHAIEQLLGECLHCGSRTNQPTKQ